MKKIITLCVLILTATIMFSEELPKQRGMYIALGGGVGHLVYPEPLKSALIALEDSGFDRSTINANLSIGGAVNEKGYILGSFSLYSASWELGLDYFRLYNVMYSAGFRYYPYVTGLVLGIDLGAAQSRIQASNVDNTGSDFGLGYDLSVAYDIDRNSTGFTFLVGLKFGTYDIEGDNVYGFGLFGNVAWKEGLRR